MRRTGIFLKNPERSSAGATISLVENGRRASLRVRVMAPDRLGSGSRFVRTLFNGGTVGGASDAELLHRFVTSHGEPAELAFSVLVDRHGPMVLRTCPQALRHDGAAEDAVQPTCRSLTAP